MNVKRAIINLINKLPYVRGLYQESENFKRNSNFPPGHYYSPIIMVEEIKKREHEIWNKANKDGIEGIELRVEEQLKLIDILSKYYAEFPFKEEKQDNHRFRFDNAYFSYTDSILLYSILRHYKPKRIIEIGAGFSSALMLDTNELFLNNEIDLTFIDPYPERIYKLISDDDKKKVTVIESDVQQVPVEEFKKLQSGDILFIDGTHNAKTDSDVNYLLFEILPALQSGVMIHIHDIFYPFEYTKEWVFGGWNWNEAYLVKAFLMYNDKYDIELFSEYLHLHHKEAFKKMPLAYKHTGCSLWISKK